MIYDLIFETIKNPAVYPGRVGVKNPGGVGVTIFAGVLTPPGSRLGYWSGVFTPPGSGLNFFPGF